MQLIESKEKSIKYSLFIFLFLFVLLAPFSLRNSRDGVTPQKINDSSVGYYQSTTCNLSLFEVIFKNLGNNNKIYINNNDYVGIECYGKVTGLDKVNDTYFLSIGTNVSTRLSKFLVIQSADEI